MCDWYLRLAMDSAVIFLRLDVEINHVQMIFLSKKHVVPWVLNVVPYCTHPNQEKIVFFFAIQANRCGIIRR